MISRFSVMAVLQAARAKKLGLPDESAFSWGLNRAIFYAAAKRGFKGRGVTPYKSRDSEKKVTVTRQEGPREFFLGDEKAFLDKESSSEDRPVFEIGDEAQTASDFEKQIVARFGDESSFKEAWDEAQKIVMSYTDDTLKSQHEFFEKVYKPRRDVLSNKWSEEFTTGGKKKAISARAVK